MIERHYPTLADVLSEKWPDIKWSCVGDFNEYANFIPNEGMTLPPESEAIAARISAIKECVIKQLSDECEAHITAGFISFALGDPHIYDSEIPDQVNLFGALLATAPSQAAPSGTDIYYACREVGAAVKEYHLHTHQQLQVVLYEGAQFKLQMLQKFHMKRLYILGLPSDETFMMAIDQITWDSVE